MSLSCPEDGNIRFLWNDTKWHSHTSQKTAMFVYTTVQTSYLTNLIRQHCQWRDKVHSAHPCASDIISTVWSNKSAPSQPFTFSWFYPMCSFLLPAIKVSEISKGLHHSFLKQKTVAAQYNIKHRQNQGCKNFPHNKELPQNSEVPKGAWSTFHPQTIGLIIQNSVDMVTWHLRFVHSWANYFINGICCHLSKVSVRKQNKHWGGTSQVLKYMSGDSLPPESFSGVLKQWTYHQLPVKCASKLIPCI